MKKLTGLFPFWTDEITDNEKTSAILSVNKPDCAGISIDFDQPWDGNCLDFLSVIREEGFIRLYYEAWSYPSVGPIRVCYAESHDGGVTFKPVRVGLYEYEGSYDNNIVMPEIPDNFTVTKDENPDCPPEQKYKATMSRYNKELDGNELVLLAAPDGIRFKEIGVISTGLAYDTQNVLIWNRHAKKYFCYMRDYHSAHTKCRDTLNEESVRGISVMESADLVNWSEAKEINFVGNKEDYPLYVNNVFPYVYDDRYYIGFPVRYVERKEWNASFERLCGKAQRKWRMYDAQFAEPRFGLTLTDCLFMTSTDNYNWHRFDEACLVPGYEYRYNWLYGDCYPAVGGVIPTPGRYEGYPDELSVYVWKHHWGVAPTVKLERFVWRRDGFASYKAGYDEKKLVTKPVTFEGGNLSINFATSARGYIIIRILDEDGNPIEGFATCELFGDTVSRTVDFEKPLAELWGKKVRFEFSMCDAQLYSMTFSE
ncbi:MAG: hypothetical protein E7656_08590 [Ruminococcaceae bacterium]|nr:hypothetical protein [Oscillospiraceae bacterium]